MDKHIRHIRQRSPGTAALCAGLLGIALLCSPLASAAGRVGLDGQGGIVETAAGVGMQGRTPMAFRDVRGSGLPQLHDDAATVAEKNKSVPFSRRIVVAQAASTPDFIFNACRETEHEPDNSVSPFGGIHPAHMLGYYLSNMGPDVKPEDVKITPLSGPQHGKLNGYLYKPTPGYLGDDRATFMAEYKGKHYKIVVTIKVLAGVDENTPVCPAPTLIKVNSKPVSGERRGKTGSERRGQV